MNTSLPVPDFGQNQPIFDVSIDTKELEETTVEEYLRIVCEHYAQRLDEHAKKRIDDFKTQAALKRKELETMKL